MREAHQPERGLGKPVKRTISSAEVPPRTSAKNIAPALVIGLLAGVLGLAPWLITGARLPLQNLWGSDAPSQQIPLVLLPLSQYQLTNLVALLTVGGAVAGLAVRIWYPARRRLVTWCAAAGVLAVHIAATIQAFVVVNAGLVPGSRSSLYLAGLLAGVLGATAASLIALLLIASRSRSLAALGVALIAVPFGYWSAEWLANLAGVPYASPAMPVIVQLLPAALVGVTLAWYGLRPARHALVWLASLAVLWVVPAVFRSVNSALGTRSILGNLQEMAVMGHQVLSNALGPDGGAGVGVLLALAIALAAMVARRASVRRRAR
ncbi:hypothetical protein [Arthrobacter sp. NA-172]|uniref:hypothetical protein n=1 Tax=Arthrobacter sp. NA-172 TaxID=3367524 RepID=UPI00375480D1